MEYSVEFASGRVVMTVFGEVGVTVRVLVFVFWVRCRWGVAVYVVNESGVVRILVSGLRGVVARVRVNVWWVSKILFCVVTVLFSYGCARIFVFGCYFWSVRL